MPDNRFQSKRVSTEWDLVLSQAERQGIKFKLNQGRRSFAEQLALVRSKGVWSPANPHGAARPTPWAPHIRVGRQDHALDINQPDGGMFRWLMDKGLRPARTVPGEPWHYEVDRAALSNYAKRVKHFLATQATPAKAAAAPAAISKNGVDLIKGFEGGASPDGKFRAYQDAVGVWTIGYGHTGPDTKSMGTLTEAQAAALLKRDLDKQYVPNVTKLGLPLNQNQLDALVSFGYNLGPGYFGRGHTMGDALAKHDWKAAAEAFALYNKAGGKTLAGLTARRRAERDLFIR